MDPHMLDDMDPPLPLRRSTASPAPPAERAVLPAAADRAVLPEAAAEPPPPPDAGALAAAGAGAAAAAMLAGSGVADVADADRPARRRPARSAMARAPLLEVDHLAMRFGGLTAVDNLSFVARTGEITALIGPNGAGKTTVFNCITGFYRPTSGAIRLHTTTGLVELQRLKDFEITSKARVARTFQNIRLFSGMTVLENLMVAQHRRLVKEAGSGPLGFLGGLFTGTAFRRSERAGVERAVIWLDRIGLTARADDPAGDLPYGDQRRLEIARAMLTEPVLLCLDEPAAGLNPRESAELARLLRAIRDDDATAILLIEHDMSVVMDISDHVVVLEYGRRIADGTPDQVKNDPNVIKAYLGVEHDALTSDDASPVPTGAA